MANIKFWNTINPFLTNKGINFLNDFITIVKDSEVESNARELVELFNENYVSTMQVQQKQQLGKNQHL